MTTTLIIIAVWCGLAFLGKLLAWSGLDDERDDRLTAAEWNKQTAKKYNQLDRESQWRVR